MNRVGDVSVITIREGNLDRRNTDQFKKAVAPFVEPKAKVALDLGQVHSIDGSGCGAVLSLQKDLKAVGGSVKLFSLHKPVRNLFLNVHLHRNLDIFNIQNEAVRSFRMED